MKYFTLLDMEPAFNPDLVELRKRFLNKMKDVHPDLGVLKTGQENLNFSAELNHAYGTLKDPMTRLGYILTEKMLLDNNDKSQLSPDFLMQMIELNEEFSQEMDSDSIVIVAKQLEDFEASLRIPISQFLDAPNIPDNTPWQLMKEYYLKIKYLLRLKEKIQ